MVYKVRLTATDEGFAVSCPGLPGCWSQGDTEAEALANIQMAIEDYLGAGRAAARRPGTEVDVTALTCRRFRASHKAAIRALEAGFAWRKVTHGPDRRVRILTVPP